jgi:hypothetical protein
MSFTFSNNNALCIPSPAVTTNISPDMQYSEIFFDTECLTQTQQQPILKEFWRMYEDHFGIEIPFVFKFEPPSCVLTISSYFFVWWGRGGLGSHTKYLIPSHLKWAIIACIKNGICKPALSKNPPVTVIYAWWSYTGHALIS